MKQLSARFIGSLCVAAGSLTAALPAQAILAPGVSCKQSTATLSNVGHLGCRGPTENPRPVFDGEPDGNPLTGNPPPGNPPSEPNDPGGLKGLFYSANPARPKELTGIYSDIFVFKKYSEDPVTGAAAPDSPFRNDPHGSTGTLLFKDRLVGVFVVALEGERFLSGPSTGLGSNFSFYLFNANAPGSTVNTTGLLYDTLGLSNSTGTSTSPSLAFAGLYVEKGAPQGGGAVPEPAGLALLATAFGALALTTRRRGG